MAVGANHLGLNGSKRAHAHQEQRPKNPVPANHRKGVVYSIPCATCPCTYIGQTGRSLNHHLREHRQALKNGDLGTFAFAEHVFSSNHWLDLSKGMVSDTHSHTQTHCMLEAGTYITNSPHSTGTGVLCQDSMLHYWPDCTTIWHSSNECVNTVINLCFAFSFRLCIRFY